MANVNFHPQQGFKFPATTANVNGVIDYEALRAKNNRVKPKKNFFTKQIQKFGQNWIEKRSDQDLQNAVRDVLRDMVKGNFSPEDFDYFYNAKFSRAIRTGTFEKLNYYYPLAVASQLAINYYAGQNITIPNNYKEVYDQQLVLYSAYTDFQAALSMFSAVSADRQAAIQTMVDYQNLIHQKYFYASRCF